jgi:mRNA guanylyltransferase
MQLAYGIEMMFRDILPKLGHGNDGLIFTSLDAEYVCGTDEHMFRSLRTKLMKIEMETR